MNSPVVVWQHNGLRIVAVDSDTKADGPILLMEQSETDALGVEAWNLLPICEHTSDDLFFALNSLMLEVASHNKTLPIWVQDFVEDHRDFGTETSKPGAAS